MWTIDMHLDHVIHVRMLRGFSLQAELWYILAFDKDRKSGLSVSNLQVNLTYVEYIQTLPWWKTSQ